jgi:hypothetical protein
MRFLCTLALILACTSIGDAGPFRGRQPVRNVLKKIIHPRKTAKAVVDRVLPVAEATQTVSTGGCTCGDNCTCADGGTCANGVCQVPTR